MQFVNNFEPRCQINKLFARGTGRLTLNLQGLTAMVNSLMKDPVYKDIENLEVQEIHSFSLWQTKELFKEGKIKRKIFLLVNNSNGHVTPVFVGGTFGSEIIITDSLGRWHENIELIKKEARKTFYSPDIFVFSPKRQLDGLSCPFFSLQDVFSNSITDLFQYRYLCPYEFRESGEGCTIMKRYPPEFMKLSQEVEEIREYINDKKLTEKDDPDHSEDSAFDELKSLLISIDQEYPKDQYGDRQYNTYGNKIMTRLLDLLIKDTILNCVPTVSAS